MDIDARRVTARAWSAEEEARRRVRVLREELAAYSIGEREIAACGEARPSPPTSFGKTARAQRAQSRHPSGRLHVLTRRARPQARQQLEALLARVKGEWAARWARAHALWRAARAAPRRGGVLARGAAAAAAAGVAQKLWALALEAEESRDEARKSKALDPPPPPSY